jgi:hypothetical protein
VEDFTMSEIKQNTNNNAAKFSKILSSILESTQLSKEEKIQTLRQMAYDEREKEVAEEENMSGSSLNSESHLHEILKALLNLQIETDLPKPPPTKHA